MRNPDSTRITAGLISSSIRILDNLMHLYDNSQAANFDRLPGCLYIHNPLLCLVKIEV